MNINSFKIKKTITPILKDFDINYAALFGSVARGENKEDSDIDLLIDIGHPMGMVSYMRFINELEKKLNSSVDVVSLNSIQPSLKREIRNDLKVIYEKR
jgi:uncharacterized protein